MIMITSENKMILSGSKSYYDSYTRKRDTSRTLHDPPSLLTDRGAYVNFLEVQLERVSAACLGVQGYDQRFCDMQDLIVCLEQRCAGTTKLVSIAQQCTEELKNVTETKFDKIIQEVKTENWEMKRMLEAMSARIASVEHNSSILPGVVNRIENLERRLSEDENIIENNSKNIEDDLSKINRELLQCKDSQNIILEEINRLNATDSKLAFEIEEISHRTKGMLATLDDKVKDDLQTLEESFMRSLSIASSKTTSQIEAIKVDIVNRESGCLSKIRLQGESVREDILNMNQKWNEDIRKMSSQFQDRITTECEYIRSTMVNKLESLANVIENQKELTLKNDETAKQQFKKYDETIGSLSSEQEDLFRITFKINEALKAAASAAQSANMLANSNSDEGKAVAAERIRLTHEILKEELRTLATKNNQEFQTTRANGSFMNDSSKTNSKNFSLSRSIPDINVSGYSNFEGSSNPYLYMSTPLQQNTSSSDHDNYYKYSAAARDQLPSVSQDVQKQYQQQQRRFSVGTSNETNLSTNAVRREGNIPANNYEHNPPFISDRTQPREHVSFSMDVDKPGHHDSIQVVQGGGLHDKNGAQYPSVHPQGGSNEQVTHAANSDKHIRNIMHKERNSSVTTNPSINEGPIMDNNFNSTSMGQNDSSFQGSFDRSEFIQVRRSAPLPPSNNHIKHVHADEMNGNLKNSKESIQLIDRNDNTIKSVANKIETPLLIHSPSRSKRGDDKKHASGRSSKDYLDYVGGGLYSDGESAHAESVHQRAVKLGLSYIGGGLYASTNKNNISMNKTGVTANSTTEDQGLADSTDDDTSRNIFEANLSKHLAVKESDDGDTKISTIDHRSHSSDDHHDSSEYKETYGNTKRRDDDTVENAFRNFLSMYRTDQKNISSRYHTCSF